MHHHRLLASLLLHVCFLGTGAIPEEPTNKLPPVKQADEAVKLDGIYFCKGRDLKGDAYFGAVTIQQIRDVYLFNWMTGKPTSGIGQRIGDNLVVGWSGEGGLVGNTVYQIQAGRKLVGRWVSLPGNGKASIEILEWLKDLPSGNPE